MLSKIFVLKNSFLLPKSTYVKKSLTSFSFRYPKYYISNVNESNMETSRQYTSLNDLTRNIENINDWKKCVETLVVLEDDPGIDKTLKKEIFYRIFHNLPVKEINELDNKSKINLSDYIVQVLQNKIESIEPASIIASSSHLSKYDSKYFKTYWHFLEFLITRTKFLNLFSQ